MLICITFKWRQNSNSYLRFKSHEQKFVWGIEGDISLRKADDFLEFQQSTRSKKTCPVREICCDQSLEFLSKNRHLKMLISQGLLGYSLHKLVRFEQLPKLSP